MTQDSIPSGWARATLGELAEVVGGLAKGKKRKAGEKLREVPYLRVANVQRGHLDLGDVRRIEATTAEIEKLRLEVGDVLFTEGGDRDKLGRGWIWSGEVRECIHQNHVFRARLLSDRLEPKYVSWFGNHEGASYFLRTGKQTTNLASISMTKLRGLPLRLPPAEEQRRIVDKIDALETHSQRAKEALDTIPPLLERFRQSVLAAAFRGDLTADWRVQNPDVEPADQLVAQTETPPRPKRYKSRSIAVIPGDAALSIGNPETPLPRGWKWVPLVDVARLESGHTPSRRHPEWWGGQVPWIGLRDASQHHGGTITETRQYTNEAGLANSAARLLPAGTVCLSRTATIGYSLVMGREMATSQDFANWVCTDAVDPQWLKLLFVTEKQSLLRFSAQSTNIATIYYPELISFHVSLPPIEEQREIVRRVAERLALVEVVEASFDAAAAAVPVLDRSILAKAFRGELVPQDPNDEPASVLLERIRAHASAEPKRKAKRRRRKAKGA